MLLEKVKYTELGIRKAVRSYWWYSTGSPYLFLLVPYTAFLIYQIMTDDIIWQVWVIGCGVFIYSLMMILIYVVYLKTHLGCLRSMKEPLAILVFSDECLSITVGNEVEEIAWSSITNIRKEGDHWILLLSPRKYHFMVLPVLELTDAAKSFIVSSVEALLYRTYQIWKIRAQLACGHIVILLAVGPLLIKSFPHQWIIPSYAIGGVFAVSALVLFFSIRCPKCRAIWVRELSIASSPDSLLALRKCPSCGATGKDFA